MKPQQQLVRDHDPAAGIYGDCYRTALATLLNLDAETLPHFFHGMRDGSADWVEVDEWLFARGMYRCVILFDVDALTILSVMEANNPGLGYLLICRGSGPEVDHVVVAHRGKIISDPTTGGPASARFLRPGANGCYVVHIIAAPLGVAPSDLSRRPG